MAYRLELDNARSMNKLLKVGIAGLAVVCVGLWFGWASAPTRLTIHVPPDLRVGATMKADEIPPANVYAFAHYLLQQINYWPDDGSKDYSKNIFQYSNYVTPSFKDTLLRDLDARGKQGELLGRTRSLHQVPGHGFADNRVDIAGNGAWVVWLDFEIIEAVRGVPVKKTAIRYPLKVQRFEASPDSNPWGLALDGFGEEGPRRLTEAELHQNASNANNTNSSPSTGGHV